MSDARDTGDAGRLEVTVFEHHDADGVNLEIAMMRAHRWEFLTIEEARDLANELLDAADLADVCSEEFDVDYS